MKTKLSWTGAAALALLTATLLAPRAYAHCGHCGVGEDAAKTVKSQDASAKPHDCKDGMCNHHKAGCAAKIEGSQVTATNTADGVTIAIKGKDAASIKKIQEMGAKMAAGTCCAGEGHDHKAHDHTGHEQKSGKKKQ